MRPLLATVEPGCINSICQTTRRARLARRPLLAINLAWINGPDLSEQISTRQFDLFLDFTVWSDRWCKMHIFSILELYWRFLLLTHLLSNVLSLLDNKKYESIVHKLFLSDVLWAKTDALKQCPHSFFFVLTFDVTYVQIIYLKIW